MEQRVSKRKYNLSFLILLVCIFCLTLGQFIPIYFIDTKLRMDFYLAIFILLILSVGRTIFKRVWKSGKEHISSAWFFSILCAFATSIVFGIWVFALLLTAWTEAATLFVKRDNSKIKIITRYVNEGAFGGGTEPEDFETVVHRPILFYLKMETPIDTTTFDTTGWIKMQN